jgi:hypothetical protein
MSVKKGAFVVMPHADSLPNGGNTPEKKTNKRVKVSKSKKSSKLDSRRADYDAMKSSGKAGTGYHRPGSHK